MNPLNFVYSTWAALDIPADFSISFFISITRIHVSYQFETRILILLSCLDNNANNWTFWFFDKLCKMACITMVRCGVVWCAHHSTPISITQLQLLQYESGLSCSIWYSMVFHYLFERLTTSLRLITPLNFALLTNMVINSLLIMCWIWDIHIIVTAA